MKTAAVFGVTRPAKKARTRSSAFALLGCTAILVAGCLPNEKAKEEDDSGVGQARLSLGNAPSDVFCVRVSAVGAVRSVVSSFDILPGQSASFTMSLLPVGPLAFSAQTYGVVCSTVTPTSPTTWVADPTLVTVAPGAVATVNLLLKRNGKANVGVDFEQDDAGLPPGFNADAGVTPDAATPDAATPDAATPDAATPDATTPDAELPDVAAPAVDAPPAIIGYERSVAATEDDAEEFTTVGGTTGVDVTSSDLEMAKDPGISATDTLKRNNQIIGLRFSSLMIPKNATIVSAYVQFVSKPQTGSANDLLNASAQTAPADTGYIIKGEASDAPGVFTATAGNISSRPTTAASSMWSLVPAWPVGTALASAGDTTADASGVDQRTPDIKSILQEQINRPGWATGGAVVFTIADSRLGTMDAARSLRSAHSFSASPAGTKAPRLVVQYTAP